MQRQFERTELLLGREALEILRNSRVAVFGIGGVGGYVTEALARSGVGTLILIDSDEVSLTNLNRQIIATHSTIGRAKVDVMRERIMDINPEARVETHRCFYLPETKDAFDFSQYSYVVDAVDTVTAKIALVLEAQRLGVPIISSMGTGNKLDPTRFEVADIYETSVCPLAKVMRRELKKRGVEHLKVVYSKEEPLSAHVPEDSGTEQLLSAHVSKGLETEQLLSAHVSEGSETERSPINKAGIKKENAQGEQSAARETPPPGRRAIPGSVAFVPSAAGLILAGEVIRDLLKK